MGRWAQRQQRGGGPTLPTAPLTILNVRAEGDVFVTAKFSRAVRVTPIPSLGSFKVAGGATACNLDEVTDQVEITTGIIPVPGDTWQLISQPPWLLEAIAPQSGICI